MADSDSSLQAAVETAGNYDWIIGVVLCFMGSVLSNMGVNFQKKCHMMLAEKAKAAAAAAAKAGRPSNLPKPKVVLQPLWIGGLVGIALGSAMDLFSFGFAPLSLLAPLGAMVRAVIVTPERTCVRSPPVSVPPLSTHVPGWGPPAPGRPVCPHAVLTRALASWVCRWCGCRRWW